MEEISIKLSRDGISVADKEGRYTPIPAPSGVEPLAFRTAVTAYYTMFMQEGKQPSPKELHKFWPDLPEKTYGTILASPEFAKALEYRGVAVDPKASLTVKQQLALMKMTDPFDHRATSTKLKELGVPLAAWQAWLKQPLFAGLYRKRIEDTLGQAQDLALQRLIGNVDKGDQRAIEKVLEITGRWNPQNNAVEDARTVIIKIVEAVVKHVTDAETRRAIMTDVESTMISYRLANTKAIEG